jgi:prolipoprotein diacylglyceryl transferase
MRLTSDLPLVLSSIPSPGTWGRQYRLYGIMIALGVIFGLELARRRWANRGGNPEDMSSIALWAVPAGLIGARLYHVITDNELYRGHWFDIPWAAGANSPFAIWQGGLGIPGGIMAGVAVGVVVARKKGIRLGPGLDAVAPALALAQAIGRWGNYFNVELYGSPTTLPWGLDVPLGTAGRPPLEPATTLFHPTFLYESLWNFGLVLLLIWIDSKRVLRPGRIFALYIGGYFLGRLWVEALRVDFANTILGLRVNTWMSLIAIAGVLLFFLVAGLKRRPEDRDDPYQDGHTWDPERAVIPPPAAEADTDGDGEPRSAAGDPDLAGAVSSGDRPRSAGGSAASGTKARAARRATGSGGEAPGDDQRASGGGDDAASPEP